MIEIENITKKFGDRVALNNISFTIKKGEVVGLLGPNGAGKTTMMRILTCFFPPTNGKAKVDGIDCVENPIEVKKRIGYMTENPLLYNEMTVEAFLKFMVDVRNIPKTDKNKTIDKIIDGLKLEDVRGRIIGRLSRGYKQRVGLAQALLSSPPVLILDEPTVGLDPKQIIEIRELIKSLGGERTIILSSHILPEVSQICERIIIIDKGTIVAIDTKEELLGRLKGAERLHVDVKGDETKVLEKVKSLRGIKSVFNEKKTDGRISFNIDSELGVDIRENLFKIIVENNWILYELRQIDMSLEDVFLKLTTKEEL